MPTLAHLSGFLTIALLSLSLSAAETRDAPLFDFAATSTPHDWAPVKLAEAKTDSPAPKIEFSKDGTQSALKITFAGGQWPTIGTTVIPLKGTWKEFETVKATLTVDSAAIAYIAIGQGEQDAKALKPQWQKTLFLKPGRNDVVLTIRRGLGSVIIDPKRGEISSFIIGMFQPAEGQVLRVENVRLSTDWPQPHVTGWFSLYNHDGYSAWVVADYQRSKALPAFKVLGTDMTVAGYEELSKKLKPAWTPAPERTIDQVEADFKSAYHELKKSYPDAALAILRDGEKGYDPGNPEKTYAGWKYAYLSCHGPDGPNAGRESPRSNGETVEAFMRHRGDLLQADLSSIPKGAKILAARLVITRMLAPDMKPISKANLWVTEPCNREWDTAADCYYYAKGKPWKAVSGLYYGEDPDFYPVLLSHGPGSSPVNAWDFTAALKYWIEEGHEYHGFFLYGDSNDYMLMRTQQSKDIRQRPAILVVYSPGAGN